MNAGKIGKKIPDNSEVPVAPKPFKLGPLGTLNQVIVALGKTIRAMAADEIDSQKGARIANALGIQRQCLETVTLDRLEAKLDGLSGAVEGRRYGHQEPDPPAVRPH
jgi:hypothetical protein